MNPYGLRSLYHLLTVYAEHFLSIGEMMKDYGLKVEGVDPKSVPNDETFEALMEVLNALRAHSAGLHLRVSTASLDRSIKEFADTTPSQGRMSGKIAEWYGCFISEMESSLFKMLLPHRVPYYSDENKTGDETKQLLAVLSSFRGAHYDAKEAGNCFAYERFTSCVHHLSRVVEFGLVAVAVHAGVEANDQRNWNTALNRANQNLREKKGNFSSIDHRDEVYYSEAIGLLRNFKTAWRNPSSHAPEIFEEPKARSLFEITKATMEHISKRHSEVSMPSE